MIPTGFILWFDEIRTATLECMTDVTNILGQTEERGCALAKRPFSCLVRGTSAALSVETGDVNSYIHIWVFQDAADRAAKRSAMAADPDWQNYLKLSSESGNLLHQVNTILTPAPFFAKPAK